MTFLFDFIRNTDLVKDAWCESVVVAIQAAANAHFTPAYGIVLDCRFVLPGTTIRSGAIQVWWLDHCEQANALGFHNDDGLPKCYIGVEDDTADYCDIGVTTSHEVWECAADPDITKTVTVGNEMFAYEVADAAEDDSFAFETEGLNGQKHLISAFALPSWFDPAGVAPFTFPVVPSITGPFELAYGGYIGVRSLPNGTWSQRFAEVAPTSPRQNKRGHSRTMRRFNAP